MTGSIFCNKFILYLTLLSQVNHLLQTHVKFNLTTFNLLYHFSLLMIISSSVNITNINFILMLVFIMASDIILNQI